MNTKEPLVSSLEMSKFDNQTIASGIASKKLMKRAGIQIYKNLFKLFSKNELDNLVILCGGGNNGGDGLVLARLLRKNNLNPKVLIASSKKYSKDFLFQLKQFKKNKDITFYYLGENKNFNLKQEKRFKKNSLEKSLIIIDSLLGNGQKEEPRKNIKEIIDYINLNKKSEQKVIAIDVPSGINPDTGEVFNSFLKADYTFSIQATKRGLLQYPAKNISGKIKILDIGIKCEETEFNLKKLSNYKLSLKRDPNSHKGNFGHVSVIGGIKNMEGASTLASLASLKSGAGKVTKLVAYNENSLIPEIMLLKVGDKEKDCFDQSHVTKVVKFIKKTSVYVIGPGLGVNLSTSKFLEKVLVKTKNIKKVIDADALTILAKNYNDSYKELLKNSILTPHPKEASLLLNVDVKEIERDRYEACRELSLKTNSTVILKGGSTIIYSNSSGVVIDGSNPFLATAGSGDVLSGFIASYIAQGLNLFNAGVLGALVHLESGNIAIKNKVPLIASDIIDNHHSVVRELYFKS